MRISDWSSDVCSSDLFLREAEKNPGLVNLDSDLRLNKPQLDVEVDRERVADTGVGVLTLGRTLETLLGGRQVTRLNQNGEQYDVIVQVAPDDRRTSGDLNDIYVRGRDGAMNQLSHPVQLAEPGAAKDMKVRNGDGTGKCVERGWMSGGGR